MATPVNTPDVKFILIVSFCRASYSGFSVFIIIFLIVQLLMLGCSLLTLPLLSAERTIRQRLTRGASLPEQ